MHSPLFGAPFGSAAGAGAAAFGSAAPRGGGGTTSAGGVGSAAAAAAVGSIRSDTDPIRSDTVFTPQAAQGADFREATREQQSRMLGLPFDVPAVPNGAEPRARPVDLEAFFHACEVSFMVRLHIRFTQST